MGLRMDFEVEVDGVIVPLMVNVTTAARKQARIAYHQAYHRARQAGAPSAVAVERRCEEWWTRARRVQRATLLAAIRALEERLGSAGLTPDEAQVVNDRLVNYRTEMYELMRGLAAVRYRGAPCIAAQAEFDALVAATTFHRDGRPYFKNVEDYQQLRDRAGGHPVATRACWLLSEQVLGVSEQDAESCQALFNKLVLAGDTPR